MRVRADENWIALIGETGDLHNVITNLGGLTVEVAQKALDKTYPNRFTVLHHGTVHVVRDNVAAKAFWMARIERGEHVSDEIRKRNGIPIRG